ncbi:MULTISPECIES: APC family permease [Bifidobacterium]|uniref:Amino acid permease n=2 Tax=Bifidobacterium TaxID=1678 RepID=A0A261FKN2_9BIFI|nr:MULTISPECIES: APC family permease [Bifidobacterium]OZG59730.1 amino acid permease [Bifidobacterium lemurum]OZG64616.1 amino acid permease [Bifidobacterium eulemuris]QOL32366.1 APC family permease [Bifidobacterium eulemuris]QOL35024.1 APC family permease [Bifidobacterium lemurum]
MADQQQSTEQTSTTPAPPGAGGGLQKSLKLVFVYTVATGSIFTFVSYWDSVFFSYCGAGTFLAFALMTLAILPVALVYSEISPLFKTAGGELIYNTVGFNKHVGFLASWLIMAAWISVPPAVVMAIATYISKLFGLNLSFGTTVLIGVVILVLVFIMSLQDIQFLVKAQATCLFANIATTLITAVLLLTCGHWSISNLAGMFSFSSIDSTWAIPGWIIGMALLITPYFGFETVPQMVEEGDFPIANTKKAICGSVITCGVIYTIFFFCVAGLAPAEELLAGDSANGFMTINAMENMLGWRFWPVVYGLISILMGMTASILGFWMSTVRMLYSMGKKNFLPEVFTKVNKHQQPILPNIFLLGVSLTFILLQNAGSFMNDFFNLMSFGCACAYALTMVSAVRIRHKHPQWYENNKNVVRGGDALRILAMVIMIAIAFFCTLGQGIGSWISFGVYLGIGVLIWAWMVLVRWKQSTVTIETPDGEQTF